MEQKQLQNNQPPVWPWKHLLGFVLCIALTAFSLTGYLYSAYEPKILLIIISVLAFSQALIQLFRLQPQD
ncbi:hypothetical protein [Halobacillus salinus]|uniref:Uncharacterized protein n=1 Tax=Halobacillus salinus TaxID=192814 RepID=A0A4Z0H4K6_9BACI|nr:hypothetical protein [Halobacillus salinus]TGB04854.1 hypothetical protein E4663_07630 [Halobacillus salinus]